MLRQWNQAKIGNVFENFKKAKEELKLRELGFPEFENPTDLISLNQCQATYLRALEDEESLWRQKARIRSATEGDQYSRFFSCFNSGSALLHVYF